MLWLIIILEKKYFEAKPQLFSKCVSRVKDFFFWIVLKIFWLIHREQSFKLSLESLAIQAFPVNGWELDCKVVKELI